MLNPKSVAGTIMQAPRGTCKHGQKRILRLRRYIFLSCIDSRDHYVGFGAGNRSNLDSLFLICHTLIATLGAYREEPSIATHPLHRTTCDGVCYIYKKNSSRTNFRSCFCKRYHAHYDKKCAADISDERVHQPKL